MTASLELRKPEMLLQCADDLRLCRDVGGRIAIDLADRRVWHGETRVMEILSVFGRPTTLAEGLKQLTVNGPEWASREETVRTLITAGILVDDAARAERVEAGPQSFNGAPVHVRMLNDRVRTSRLIDAIRAEVRPGDVVVEVGTGTGVLAVAAARAGARHVYAIEGGAMVPVARDLVRANGLADRVTIVEGWSHTVDLPERGDVFVSETIGNAGFDENLVEIARDAAERLLKPGARMIPRGLRLRALPVEAPAEWLARQVFRTDATQRWGEWYGIDFSVLASLPATQVTQQGALLPGDDRTRILGPAFDLASAEFFPARRSEMTGTPVVEIESAGTWNALRVFFDTELAPGIVLSTDPRKAAGDIPDHWGNPIWPVPARAVMLGQRWPATFAWGADGRYELSVGAVGAL